MFIPRLVKAVAERDHAWGGEASQRLPACYPKWDKAMVSEEVGIPQGVCVDGAGIAIDVGAIVSDGVCIRGRG